MSRRYSPVMEGGDLGRTLQILLKPELEGLSDGADDVLGQPVAALQNVARWGSKRHRPLETPGRQAPAQAPTAAGWGLRPPERAPLGARGTAAPTARGRRLRQPGTGRDPSDTWGLTQLDNVLGTMATASSSQRTDDPHPREER